MENLLRLFTSKESGEEVNTTLCLMIGSLTREEEERLPNFKRVNFTNKMIKRIRKSPPWRRLRGGLSILIPTGPGLDGNPFLNTLKNFI